MPLRLTLRPREKFFLNGAVIVNGETRADLTLLNDVSILREKDIMTEESVDTVCKQIYFLVQLIYIDQPNLDDYKQKLNVLLAQVTEVAPTAVPYLDRIRDLVAQGDYYLAMKVARQLISIEKELLENARESN